MSPKRLIVLAVVPLMMSVVVLALASPPDPVWLGGLWDNDDFDDIVVLVTSGVGIADSHWIEEDVRPVIVVCALVPVPDEDRPAARPPSSSPPRAPPAV